MLQVIIRIFNDMLDLLGISIMSSFFRYLAI